MFNYDYENSDQCVNWCSEIKSVFNTIDMIDTYNNKTIANLQMVKSKLLQYYADDWPNKVLHTPKLRTYVQFKTAYQTEEYIKLNLNRSERSILAQFRCGVLPLRIETGRFVGEKPEERLCTFCGLRVPEDETHFFAKLFIL